MIIQTEKLELIEWTPLFGICNPELNIEKICTPLNYFSNIKPERRNNFCNIVLDFF